MWRDNMVPHWFHNMAVISLVIAGASSLVVTVDVFRHPQKMWIMNVVWPVTALFGSLFILLFYWQIRPRNDRSDTPSTPIATAKAALHCGAGCTLGDIIAEWLCFFVPVVALWFGWHSVFEQKIFAVWVLDFILAFVIGIAFQFFTIRPMRDLSVAEGLRQAVKADAASLTAWQVGMYGFMAIGHFWLFKRVFNTPLEVGSVEFWFLMQIAMLAGFLTAYPINWLLVQKGTKERM